MKSKCSVSAFLLICLHSWIGNCVAQHEEANLCWKTQTTPCINFVLNISTAACETTECSTVTIPDPENPNGTIDIVGCPPRELYKKIQPYMVRKAVEVDPNEFGNIGLLPDQWQIVCLIGHKCLCDPETALVGDDCVSSVTMTITPEGHVTESQADPLSDICPDIIN